MNYTFKNITIRTGLRPGDLGQVLYLHGWLYAQEYQYTLSFESYVAKGLYEFGKNYEPGKDRVWICEDRERFIGFLLLIHRPHNAAQLRYFVLHPEYRGIGLGRKMMDLYMEFFQEKNYSSSYLWTTNEQLAAAGLYRRYGFVLTEEKPSDAFGKRLMEQRYDMKPGKIKG